MKLLMDGIILTVLGRVSENNENWMEMNIGRLAGDKCTKRYTLINIDNNVLLYTTKIKQTTETEKKNQFTLSRECEKMRKTSEHTKLHQKTLWNTSNRVSIFLLTSVLS